MVNLRVCKFLKIDNFGMSHVTTALHHDFGHFATRYTADRDTKIDIPSGILDRIAPISSCSAV